MTVKLRLTRIENSFHGLSVKSYSALYQFESLDDAFTFAEQSLDDGDWDGFTLMESTALLPIPLYPVKEVLSARIHVAHDPRERVGDNVCAYS